MGYEQLKPGFVVVLEKNYAASMRLWDRGPPMPGW